MHPAIKLLSLVLISLFVTQGNWLTLIVTGVLILPFYLIRPDLWTSAFRMLNKLKWFFLSILLVYIIFTPALSQPFSHQYFITLLLPATFRISVLVLILFSVNLFIQTTSKEQILTSLLWLLSPLKLIHIDIERMALRAVLTLDYIETLNYQMSQYKQQNLAVSRVNPDLQGVGVNSLLSLYKQKKNAFFHLIKHSGIILREIIIEADSTSGQIYQIEPIQAPLLVHYLIPVMIALLLILTLYIY